MKRIVVIFVIFQFTFCQRDKNPISFLNDIIGEYDKSYILKDEDILLRKAFYLNSEHMLSDFFRSWNNGLNPLSSKEFNSLNDTLKQVYFLYKSFYQLLENYQNAEYLVLQNDIDIALIDSLDYDLFRTHGGSIINYDSTINKIRIDNFLPFTEGINKKHVYLNRKYLEILNFFFNETSGYVVWYDYKKFEKGYLEKKVDFFSSKIIVSHHHWIPAFHYYSFPRIYEIIFNYDLTKAIIYYRDSYWTGGGVEFIFEKSK